MELSPRPALGQNQGHFLDVSDLGKDRYPAPGRAGAAGEPGKSPSWFATGFPWVPSAPEAPPSPQPGPLCEAGTSNLDSGKKSGLTSYALPYRLAFGDLLPARENCWEQERHF
jgi:hypothetical protein